MARHGFGIVLAGALLCSVGTVLAADKPPAPFTVTSPKFKDGGMLSNRYGGGTFQQSACGGGNMSPPLAWKNAPDGTKSYAIVMSDPDGGKGLGSVHWIAYDLAPETRALAENDGATPGTKFVGGKNGRDLDKYFGPCPTLGDRPHHYVFAVYALDIPPGQLGAGLTRDALFDKIRGHILAETSIIGRYARKIPVS